MANETDRQPIEPTGGVADMMKLCGYPPEITATNKNPRQPAPVSDAEAQEYQTRYGLHSRDCYCSIGMALRLLADRARDKERLARYEAALADTPENWSAVGKELTGGYPRQNARDVLAHLRRVAEGEQP